MQSNIHSSFKKLRTSNTLLMKTLINCTLDRIMTQSPLEYKLALKRTIKTSNKRKRVKAC